jgi:hypothetical protein
MAAFSSPPGPSHKAHLSSHNSVAGSVFVSVKQLAAHESQSAIGSASTCGSGRRKSSDWETEGQDRGKESHRRKCTGAGDRGGTPQRRKASKKVPPAELDVLGHVYGLIVGVQHFLQGPNLTNESFN